MGSFLSRTAGVDAERVGNHFKIYILWKTGEITWRWYQTLRTEVDNEELQQEMRVAVSEEIARRRVTRPSEDAADETEHDDVPLAPVDTEVEGLPTQELGRGKRIRHSAQQYNAATFMIMDMTNMANAHLFFA